ncbi:MAG: sodium:calcium antiporter [Calditrichaceae bacterium]|nr:sodium:calcium antiporter [Calditrichaceae bacterium]MBN2707884.1 sodium:calcium antiporter [Calditrichaceae bacterium]RQV97832.1 MAG: sodium:calcium antiporter [Calditrichota bacterium]
MEYWLHSFIIVLSILALWWGAVWVVESASAIALKLGLSELIIGLTVVAIGTSAPEFAVTITAAIRGQSDISVGNVVGSNAFNIGFILGAMALIKPVQTGRKLFSRDCMIMIVSAGFLLFMMKDFILNRMEGILLFSCLVLYLLYLFIKKEKLEEEIPLEKFRWYEIPKLIGGLVLIIGGGHFLVESSMVLARAVGISEWAIGVTVVAAGTSAPEFATSLIATAKGKHGISAGNLVGSNLFNLFGVLGLAGIIKTLTIDNSAYLDIIILTVLILIASIFIRTNYKVSRLEGVLLIMIGLVTWYINIL